MRLTDIAAVAGLRDTAGRPLGESRAPAAFPVGVPHERRTCPYAGSRKGHPMNVSALRQASEQLDDVKAHVLYLRRALLGDAVGALDVDQALRVSHAAIVVPAFLRHRAEGALGDGELPESVGALYKTMLGIGVGCVKVLEHAAKLGTKPSLSSAEMVELVEAGGDFVDEMGEACAAPASYITDMLDCVIDGKTDGAVPESTLTELLPETDTFVAFAELALVFEIAKRMLGVVVRPLAMALRSTLASVAHAGPRPETAMTDLPVDGQMRLVGLSLALVDRLDRSRAGYAGSLGTALALATTPPPDTRLAHYLDVHATALPVLSSIEAALNRLLGQPVPAPPSTLVALGAALTDDELSALRS